MTDSETSTSKTPTLAYIDHRQRNDLAHVHSSPARSRRRSNSTRPIPTSVTNPPFQPNLAPVLPLTNRNLLTLQERHFGSVAVDMDHFGAPLETQLLNSLEFGGSNPSSDHLSDSTSLDDVCFPDYYVETKETTKWPDLEVLQHFVNEELKEASESPETSTKQKPTEQNHQNDSFLPLTNVNFRFPVASEESPLLDNKRVDDVDGLSPTESLRIRPQAIQPWEKSKQSIPILKDPKKDHAMCRFTYFREDFDKTIHSPTIGGLLATGNDNKITEDATPLAQKWRGQGIEPKQDLHNLTLQDLFMPAYYTHTSTASLDRDDIPPVSPSPANLSGHLSPDRSHNVSVSNLAKVLPTNPPTTSSIAMSTREQRNPFWLDVLNPTEEEMKVLSKTFGIHPLTTEDIFLGEAREKVELFKSYYFICFTSFDIVYERRKQKAKEQEKKFNKLQEMYDSQDKKRMWDFMSKMFHHEKQDKSVRKGSSSSSSVSKSKKVREGELSPLNMYMIVFRDAVITFHFSPTPHPINVRRRARLLRDYLRVSSDWLCYALIDDITDSFAPMISSIEEEVNSIEDAILKMHSGDTDSDDDSDSDSDCEHDDIFYRRQRSKSTIEYPPRGTSVLSRSSKRSYKSSSSKSTSSKILGWKRKGDMLRRIGECRKRVMSVLRLLGSKADVIKGFSKRLSDQLEGNVREKSYNSMISPRIDIGMYLGDIQDHIVTMTQSLNHYEKLLARFHSNYLAQINIDMTKVNNDTNDVLGKITILGTIVLPINVVTGLWGMNCLVPGQEYDGLMWFWSIIAGMVVFSVAAYNYAKKWSGL